ncbi:hypothetical protein DPMN_060620 [Dreissena polymorpha]|uniref:Mab-21-like nucleotidyltransferase domain-containing protein n=1 Tax=Dreissena polymorpha TaxID=45954 RepID=A0A9D4C6D0_DREPO|nr:hypothetical protein DPMN_060620 [Dreissena polymorpha]
MEQRPGVVSGYLYNTPEIEDMPSQLSKMVNVQKTSPIAKKIERAVFTRVTELANRVGEIQPRFRVVEVVPIGSFYEDTKLIYPNEFDFLLALHPPPGKTLVQKISQNGVALWTMTRWTAGEEQAEESCYAMYEEKDDDIENAVEINPRSLKTEWVEVLQTLVFTSPENSVDVSEPVDHLRVVSLEIKNPNIVINFIFQKSVVSVDISLSFRIKKSSNLHLSQTDASCPGFMEVLKQNDSILLIAFNNSFKVDVADLEVLYIRDKIRRKHRNMLLYLKFINNCLINAIPFGGLCFRMSSHMLKSLVILHDATCTDPDTPSLQNCINDVIVLVQASFCARHTDDVINRKSPHLNSDSVNKKRAADNSDILTDVVAKKQRMFTNPATDFGKSPSMKRRNEQDNLNPSFERGSGKSGGCPTSSYITVGCGVELKPSVQQITQARDGYISRQPVIDGFPCQTFAEIGFLPDISDSQVNVYMDAFRRGSHLAVDLRRHFHEVLKRCHVGNKEWASPLDLSREICEEVQEVITNLRLPTIFLNE